MTPKRRIYVRFIAVMAVLGITGLAATAYLLVQQRAPNPFADVYEVQAEFAAADGILGGLGQPVNVVGVKVGQVKGVELVDGRARVTFEIDRQKVPSVRRDATVVLQPITPLKDLQLELDPGTSKAPVLRKDEVLGVRQTAPVVPLSDLLSALDEDTRAFVSSMIASFDQGTAGRSDDLRAALRALGPTAGQAGDVSRVVGERRREMARLIHNLARITKAASQDRRLASLVVAGNQTLAAVASQDEALRASLREFPETLDVAESTLRNLEPFAEELGPALTALTPAVQRLPAGLRGLRPLTDDVATTLRRNLRPLVRQLQPVARDLEPSVRSLTTTTPHLTRAFQVLTYTVNELAYNPETKNQGYLFWLSWAMHNFNSVISLGDAHGGIGRAQVMANCYGVQENPGLRPIFDLLQACPK